MRFGIFIPQGWRMDLAGIDSKDDWPTMKRLAQAADAEPGWESLWVYDHFHTVPEPSEEATHDAWTLMAAFAASTERIRLGQMCTCMAYRNPVYLAKVAATIDHVSQGRIEMGIGAGWYEHEWRAYGYGFPSAGTRLGMLDEGVQIFRQAWTTGKATLEGKHYQVDGAIIRPTPIQTGRSGIPIWVAGGGEQKTLRIAAEHADYTNFLGTPEIFTRKSEILAEHCKAIGRDFDEIVRSSNYNVVIGETEKDVANTLAEIDHRIRSRVSDRSADNFMQGMRESPLTGTVEQVIEGLREAEKIGVAYTICNFNELAFDHTGVDLFTKRVMPEFR
jgi:F420-dependent oxidoreductase-like protein